eukprot:TRINITY_DN14912_c0_g1_i6.p1 TRINITY_DN14912_c0_g1~~TRINITY_DN14912_c0_g1_i6.p1  ORF type:complete len:296 (-),score=43.39 TRINITY_DN14912_c0_g1_i6:11-790(-)
MIAQPSLKDSLMSSSLASPTLPPKEPYYIIKEDAQATAERLQQNFHSWKETLDSGSTSEEFDKLTKDVKKDIATIKANLRDMSKIIKHVESNRQRFLHITDTELASRSQFVNEMSSIVRDMEATLNSAVTKRKVDQDKRALLLHDEDRSQRTKEHRSDMDSYVGDQRQHQLMIEAKQDIVLDDINDALTRLGFVADGISKELKQQESLINEITDEVDTASTSMQKALKQMDKLLGKSDKEIGRAVQQECRDRSRMPSSA